MVWPRRPGWGRRGGVMGSAPGREAGQRRVGGKIHGQQRLEVFDGASLGEIGEDPAQVMIGLEAAGLGGLDEAIEVGGGLRARLRCHGRASFGGYGKRSVTARTGRLPPKPRSRVPYSDFGSFEPGRFLSSDTSRYAVLLTRLIPRGSLILPTGKPRKILLSDPVPNHGADEGLEPDERATLMSGS